MSINKFNYAARLDALELENATLKRKLGRMECYIDSIKENERRWKSYRISQKFSTYIQGQLIDKRV